MKQELKHFIIEYSESDWDYHWEPIIRIKSESKEAIEKYVLDALVAKCESKPNKKLEFEDSFEVFGMVLEARYFIRFDDYFHAGKYHRKKRSKEDILTDPELFKYPKILTLEEWFKRDSFEIGETK